MNTEFRDVCVSVQIMFQGGLVPHLNVHQHYTPITTTTCRLCCNELKYLQMCSATSRCWDGWLGGNLFQKAKRITKLPPITAVGCNKLLDVVCKTSVPVGLYAGRCHAHGGRTGAEIWMSCIIQRGNVVLILYFMNQRVGGFVRSRSTPQSSCRLRERQRFQDYKSLFSGW